MNDETGGSVNSINPEVPSSIESNKIPPNPIFEKQLSDVFTKEEEKQNIDEPALAFVDVMVAMYEYQNNLHPMYRTRTYYDPDYLTSELSKVKWLEKISIIPEGELEGYEAYKLRGVEHTDYIEKRKERERNNILSSMEDVFQNAAEVNISSIDKSIGKKLEVSREIWNDLSLVNSIIESSDIKIHVSEKPVKVATLYWINKFFWDRDFSKEEIRRVIKNSISYLIKTNKPAKEKGDFYYAVNTDIIPEKEIDKKEAIESII